MAGFSAAWLSLREPVDVRARSAAVITRLAGILPAHRPLRVLDLGAGTGSNMRYLRPRLPEPQEWLLADRDAALLSEAAPLDPSVTTRLVDLAGVRDRDLFEGRDLVTASALLDLVSDGWIRDVCAECHRRRAAVCFALTYDGRMSCHPADEQDERIRELVNRHQRRDKGFGPALGPLAPEVARGALERLGYDVHVAASDWHARSDERDFQRLLLEGWASAATEIEPSRAHDIAAWLARRQAHLERGESTLVVGHQDLTAWLR